MNRVFVTPTTVFVSSLYDIVSSTTHTESLSTFLMYFSMILKYF